MKANDKYFEYLLSGNREMLLSIYHFNNNLSEYLHKDFFPFDGYEKLQPVIIKDDVIKNQWNDIIKNLHGISDCGSYDFSEPSSLLLLLSVEEITKIIYALGGICFADVIRKIIIRNEMLGLKQAMGDDIYSFSVRSGVLMLNAEIASMLRSDGVTIEEKVFNTGRKIIESILCDFPEQMLKRFVLKFPKHFGWSFENIQSNKNHFRLIQKVIQNIFKNNQSFIIKELGGAKC